VPYSRVAELNRKHQEEAVARAAAEARAADMEARIADLSAKALRAERALVYREYDDRPNLKAPEVRDFIEGQYAAYAAREADAAKPFASWMSEHAPTSPLLAPYFAGAPADPSAPPAKPKPADPSAGVTGPTPPAAGTRRTPAELRDMRQQGTFTPAMRADEMEQDIASGLMKATPQTLALIKQLRGQ